MTCAIIVLGASLEFGVLNSFVQRKKRCLSESIDECSPAELKGQASRSFSFNHPGKRTFCMVGLVYGRPIIGLIIGLQNPTLLYV
jgi:hypothetical protein